MSLTDSATDCVETDESDETVVVSNPEFLADLFGGLSAGISPVVVSFEGNPSRASSRDWSCMPFADAAAMATTANNYFSLASFRLDEAGRYRRRKSQFVALHVVMLDDIGTKVACDRLTVPPTWLLETSPGNFQAGYALAEPVTEGALADRLMHTMISAGLCDPGANGPRARLARLPVGANGKHSPAFQCRLASWCPDRRYLVEEIVQGFDLEMAQGGRPTRRQARSAENAGQDEDGVFVPGPEVNPVISALMDRVLYKSPLGDGKHDITCPWVAEHTGGADGGTAYFEPDDQWPVGGFRCLHGHCAERRVRDLLRHLDVEVSAARMKPTIRVVPGELHRVVDAAERQLACSGRHYQRGNLIVTVVTDPGNRETRVHEVGQPALVRALAGVALWERFDARANDWARIDPPPRHATVLADAVAYHHLPVLNGIARQPYLRSDGSLMTAAGYDRATGMFGVFNAAEFVVSDLPSRAEAEEALGLLVGLLDEFSFEQSSDRAAALSAILTAAIRPSLPHAPMFHVRAHMVGSGKSYLCELVTAFASPQRGTPTTFPSDDEECRKLLLAELLRAPAAIEFDNLTGDLVAHKSLCTVLTSEFLAGRILGASKTATVSTRALFLSSGNNVGPVQDMARRCVTITLSPQCELPAARVFRRPDLVREVLRDRGRYVSAALTIVRAWIVAERPVAECRGLAGYADWTSLCRQPLMWLGLPDPVASLFDAIAEDPDRETLGRLLRAWREVFGRSAAMVRDAVREAGGIRDDENELQEVIRDIADERGEINRRKLGWWIKRHAGRIVDGLRFTKALGSRSAELWQVESVSSVVEVSSHDDGKTVAEDSASAEAAEAYRRASRGE